MKFLINEEAFEYAVSNPFKGSNSPVSAAYGRAAEPMIVRMCSETFDVVIRPNTEVKRSEVPGWATDAKLLSTRNHDGIVFSLEGKFLGLNESKLKIAGRRQVRLTPGEYQNIELCKSMGAVYLLSIAEQLKGLEAEYLGAIDITQHQELCKRDSYGNYEIFVQEFKALLIQP